jgi:hypothetical protein
VVASGRNAGASSGGGEYISCRCRRFIDLDREGVSGSEHIAREEDTFAIRREALVGLQFVVVVCHVDEVFGVQDAGLDEVR